MSLIRPILRRPDTVDDVGKIASFNGTEIVWIDAASGGAGDPGLEGDIATLVYGGGALAGSTGKYADAGHRHPLPALSYADVGAAASAHTHVVGNVTGLDEQIRDVIGTALVQGTNIVITVNDAGNTLTFSAPDVVSSSAVGAPFGVAPLDGGGKVPSSFLPTPSGLGTASTRNVPASGDASSIEVLLGSDSRLTNARTPTAHSHVSTSISDFAEAVQDVVGAFIVPGSGMAITYDDVGNQMVLASSGGGGGSSSAQTVPYTSSITPNAALGEVVIVGQLTGNITVNNPSTPTPGQLLEFHFQQDAAGGRTVTWGGHFEVVAPIDTTILSRTMVRFRCLTTTLWVEI